MTALTPAPGMVVRLGDVFDSEIRTVRELGCELDIKTTSSAIDSGGTAYARITPVTPKATRGMALAAEQDGAPGRKAIEVKAPFERKDETLDAVRTVIGHALDIARTALQ